MMLRFLQEKHPNEWLTKDEKENEILFNGKIDRQKLNNKIYIF